MQYIFRTHINIQFSSMFSLSVLDIPLTPTPVLAHPLVQTHRAFPATTLTPTPVLALTPPAVLALTPPQVLALTPTHVLALTPTPVFHRTHTRNRNRVAKSIANNSYQQYDYLNHKLINTQSINIHIHIDSHRNLD